MKHVYQKHVNTCGVASFAMLTGISYDKSLRLFHPCREPGSIVETTSLEDDRRVFAKVGIPIMVKWKPVKLKNLHKDALISITLPIKYGSSCWCGKGHHAVVWDHKEQIIRDPSKLSYNFTKKYIEDNMEHYLCKK
jgi:hypothetical protein